MLAALLLGVVIGRLAWPGGRPGQEAAPPPTAVVPASATAASGLAGTADPARTLVLQRVARPVEPATVAPRFDWASLRADQVRPGDRLRLHWGDEPGGTTSHFVDRSGDLVLRRGGQTLRLRAAGLRIDEIRARLDALRRKQAPGGSGAVTVTDWRKSALSVLVVGEVYQPGSVDFDLRAGLSVGEAIAQAGGLLETAAPAKVRVTRNTPGVEPVQIAVNLGLDGEGGIGLRLQPNDVVLVPIRF